MISRLPILFALITIFCMSQSPVLAEGKKGKASVRVEFPGRKLAAERKGKRIDFIHIRPGEPITIKATGPVLLNLKICRVFKRGEAVTGSNFLVVASDDGMVARQKLTMKPGRGAPLPFDRKLILSKRRTYQIRVPEGEHVYVVTADPGPGMGLAVRVNKTRKPRKRILIFEKARKVSMTFPVSPSKDNEPETAEKATSSTQPPTKETAGQVGGRNSPQVQPAAAQAEKGGAVSEKPASKEKIAAEQQKGTDRAPVLETGTSGLERPVARQVPEPGKEAEPRSKGIGPALFWTAATGAVAAGLVSGGVRVWYRQEEAAYQKKLEEGATPSQVRPRRDKLVTLERVYVGFAGAAGILAITAGIAAVFTDFGSGQASGKSASASLPVFTLQPSGFTMTWSARF